MKILHIHPSLTTGGIESMICGLANEMAKTNNQVAVATIFEAHSYDMCWGRLSTKIQKVSLGKRHSGFSVDILFKIYQFIKRGNFDVVNIHGSLYYYLIAIFFLYKRINFFYTIHSDASMENSKWDKKIMIIKRFLFKKKIVRPIAISSKSLQSFVEFYNCDAKQINNGVVKPMLDCNKDLISQYRITPNTIVFLHPGRITKAKNQVLLCDAFQWLIEQKKDVVLLIAGDKQDGAIFMQLEKFLSKRIVYIGERKDIADLLAQVDGFCLSSIWEGLPISLLEALSVGCVPICTPVGGIVDVIKTGYNGILSKDVSKNSYVSALNSFLDLSEKEKKELSDNCKKTFEDYDMKICARNYLNYYEMCQ